MKQVSSAINAADIQGLIINGYTHPYSSHLIFQFGAGSKPADFTKAIYGYVQTAVPWTVKPANMLNIALTATGINKLKGYNIDPATSTFPWTFCAGPASATSQGSLNDVGPSDPSKWLFGNNTTQPVSSYAQIPVECMVHVYGMTTDDLSALVTTVATAAAAAGLTEIFPISPGKRLEQCQLPPGNVHFGYHDGIDNPSLDPSVTKMPGKSYTDPQNLNNFLIGYHGDVSYFSPGPTGSSSEAKFANNGFYNAFRMLSQDLTGFEKFLSDQAVIIAPQIGKDVDFSKEWLAAKLVGRWRDGSPLELAPDAPDPSKSDATNFNYSGDPNGLKCPITAHTRVADPRGTAMTPSNTPVPRILRRGVPYGPVLGPEYDGQSGLAGLFLVGNLPNAFEKVSDWMNMNNFTPPLAAQYPNTQDALLANRQVGGTTQAFQIPLRSATPVTNRPTTINITPAPVLPQFITTRGSAYTLFPSLSALKSCFS